MENLTPENIANGLAVFLLMFLGGLGALSGKKQRQSTPNEPPSMSVAGALIDGRDARALTDSMDRMTKAMERCADATIASSQKVERATGQIERMTDELIRNQTR